LHNSIDPIRKLQSNNPRNDFVSSAQKKAPKFALRG